MGRGNTNVLYDAVPARKKISNAVIARWARQEPKAYAEALARELFAVPALMDHLEDLARDVHGGEVHEFDILSEEALASEDGELIYSYGMIDLEDETRADPETLTLLPREIRIEPYLSAVRVKLETVDPELRHFLEDYL